VSDRREDGVALMAAPRVVVVGSSNIDMTVRLPKLPVRGETVLGGSLMNGPGGKGANQAVAAARAGGSVVFVTATGDDAFGRQSLEALAREGVDVSHARTLKGVASGVALIFVGGDGENMIGVAPGANAWLGSDDVDRLPDPLFGPGAVLLVAGLEVPIEAVARVVARAAAAGMRVVLNPAPAAESLAALGVLAGVDVITPNLGELHRLTGLPVEGDDERVRAAEALAALGPRNVVVTLGELGCLVVADGRSRRIAAHRVDAVDTVGAGDAFNGALAVALAEALDLDAAADRANAAAALAVTRPGARDALPYRPEIDRLAAETPVG